VRGVDGAREHAPASVNSGAAGDPAGRRARAASPAPTPAAHVCFGETRKVSWQSTISVGGAIYSVPRGLIDERVWARNDGDQLIVVFGQQGDRHADPRRSRDR